jgi:neutral ceramidase
MRGSVLRVALSVLLGVSSGWSSCLGASWRAGTARVAITPKESVWMAGYGARDKPSEGALHDLWAKALAFEDPAGRKTLLVTLDICGIDRALSRRIRDAYRTEHGLEESQVVLACSHTHCGPVVGENLLTMYRLDDVQSEKVKRYTAFFEQSVRGLAAEALKNLKPVRVSWETGRCDFAVNRRNNKEDQVPALRSNLALAGPVDHDAPVLRISGEDGSVLAVVFGYACHCTVLSFNQFCGDYAGFAQIALERKFPGAQAMFGAGCGADQNPLPRRTVELARKYGDELAGAVESVLRSPMRPVEGPGAAVYTEIPLRFGKLPDRAQVESDARSSNVYVASRAKKLLKTFDAEGSLATTYPYPIQARRLGDLTWIFLGGEVVVDYSLRLRRNLGASHTWVSGYCNDVMAYIPSLRVLKEGGYEGATAMIYYGLPTSWSEDVERQIVDGVKDLLGRLDTPH